MRGITATKKLEVAQYYVLGHSYKQIEDEAKVSHGSVGNIVEKKGEESCRRLEDFLLGPDCSPRDSRISIDARRR